MRVAILFLIVLVVNAQDAARDQDCDAEEEVFKKKCPKHSQNIPEQTAFDAAFEENKNLKAQLITARETIEQRRRNVTELQQEIKRQKCEDADRGLIYEGKCYIVQGITDGSHYMKYWKARNDCAKIGLALVKISDLAHQTAIEDYVRRVMPSEMNELDLWTGLRYKHKTKFILVGSGEELPIKALKWLDRYPIREMKRRPVVMKVQRRDGVPEGLWNTLPNVPLAGTICERGL